MPQLEFNNPLTIAQVVWMALIFGGLYILLARWALPQVASVLDDRAGRIAGDLEAARAAKVSADAAVAELQLAMRQANSDSQAAIAAALAQAKSEVAEQSRIANEHLDAQLAAAEQRIGVARSEAMGALHEVATETANAIVSRLTGLASDSALVSSEVDHALASRG